MRWRAHAPANTVGSAHGAADAHKAPRAKNARANHQVIVTACLGGRVIASGRDSFACTLRRRRSQPGRWNEKSDHAPRCGSTHSTRRFPVVDVESGRRLLRGRRYAAREPWQDGKVDRRRPRDFSLQMCPGFIISTAGVIPKRGRRLDSRN